MHETLAPYQADLALFTAGFFSWAISTMSAGGGSLLFMAAISPLLRGHALAPVVTVTSLIAGPTRMILFWDSVAWQVVRWYLPGATVGAVLGSWVLAHVSGKAIQVSVGIFLLSTLWQYRLGTRERSFRMRLPWFVPVSFISAAISATLGASGLLANPFYLNYGLTKERMLATRAVNSLAIQLIKIGAYLMFGLMNWDLVRHGAAAGAGAATAIWVSRPWLRKLDQGHFRTMTVAVMVLAGCLALWQQRAWLLGLLAWG